MIYSARKLLTMWVWIGLVVITGVACNQENKSGFTMKGPVDLTKIPRTFQAKMQVQYEIGIQTVRPDVVTIARKEGNVRAEVTRDGRKVIQILNEAKKKLYLISPAEKKYIELPYSPETTAQLKSQVSPFEEIYTDPKIKVEDGGIETLLGYDCQKVRVIQEKGAGKQIVTLWCAKKLQNFPIRIAGDNPGRKGTFSFVELSFDVPDSLFDPPADYTLETASPAAPPAVPAPNPAELAGPPPAKSATEKK
ncbi:MAG: DUF4412 domain-containing protein [Acidobacteria bacterium]|nr:DUF4412 domain-containing protein [Acidobacteriota bacterium]